MKLPPNKNRSDPSVAVLYVKIKKEGKTYFAGENGDDSKKVAKTSFQAN
jgi:hypothetical protein